MWIDRIWRKKRTVKEMLDRYLAEYSPTKSKRTSIRDRSLINHLLVLGHYSLDEVRPSMIAEYKQKRKREGAAPATLNYELGLLSQAFNLAINEWEWCKENPAKKVSREKVRNQIERWLTPKEEADLLKASPSWLQELITFSLYTGLRQSEVLSLKWHQVDLFRKTIILLEQKNGTKSTLPLNEKALNVLKSRAKVSQQGFVFKIRRNQIEARNVLRAFFKARDEAGLTDFRWHDLRHTWASRLVQEGCDIYTVQKLGRWKSLSMVQRYAHHNLGSLRKGIELMGREESERPSDYVESGQSEGKSV